MHVIKIIIKKDLEFIMKQVFNYNRIKLHTVAYTFSAVWDTLSLV